jgi:hypothetical protein
MIRVIPKTTTNTSIFASTQSFQTVWPLIKRAGIPRRCIIIGWTIFELKNPFSATKQTLILITRKLEYNSRKTSFVILGLINTGIGLAIYAESCLHSFDSKTRDSSSIGLVGNRDKFILGAT